MLRWGGGGTYLGQVGQVGQVGGRNGDLRWRSACKVLMK